MFIKQSVYDLSWMSAGAVFTTLTEKSVYNHSFTLSPSYKFHFIPCLLHVWMISVCLESLINLCDKWTMDSTATVSHPCQPILVCYTFHQVSWTCNSDQKCSMPFKRFLIIMCNMHVSSLFAELQKLNSMVWHYHQSEW